MVVRNNYCFTNNTGVVADALVLKFNVAVELLAVNEKDPNDNTFPYDLSEEENNTKISIQNLRHPTSMAIKIRVKADETIQVKSAIWILKDGNDTQSPIDLRKYDPLC